MSVNDRCPEAYLELAIGTDTKRLPLDTDSTCRIGRGDQNTVALVDNQVSRTHALVQYIPGTGFQLTDLGSRNGTFVNNRRVVAPVTLKAGDRITVGSSEFLFQGYSQSSTPTPVQTSQTIVDFSQQLITVLVTDIRDFTGLSRKLSEMKLSEVISTFVRESATVLSDHGAWGQKYIGDAVMAIWLHRDSRPERRDFLNIFQALLGILEIAAELHPQFGLEAPIRVGAGINTGLACVGNMGSESGADYTALSDAVNLAFRIESATKEIGCDLALGEATYEALTGHIDAEGLFKRHAVKLKGYHETKPLFAAGQASLSQLVEQLQDKMPAHTQPPGV